MISLLVKFFPPALPALDSLSGYSRVGVGTGYGTGQISEGGVSFLLHFDILFCTVCFTPMRVPRVKAEGQSFYHCVSRVVDRQFIFHGIRIVLGATQDAISWKEVSQQYRKYLFVHGSLNTKPSSLPLTSAPCHALNSPGLC